MGNTILAGLLFASGLITLFPATVHAFAGGDGSAEHPYLIANCVQLEELDNNPSDLSAHFQLADNIDCSDTINWNGNQGWVPLASFANKFTGTFDGNNKSITGLFSNREPAPGLGLFSYTENATFKDLTISGSISNSSEVLGSCTGAVAAIAFGSITVNNVHSSVDLSGAQDGIGGIVGCLLDGSGTSNIVNSTVEATLSQGAVAGLIYSADISNAARLTIANSTSAGTFSGLYAAGLIGTFIYRSWDSVTVGGALAVTDSGSSASITASSSGGGAINRLWLHHRGAEISGMYFTGSLQATAGDGVAGLINDIQTFNNNPSMTIITRSYASASITGVSGDVGGLIGKVGADHILALDQSYFGGVITTTGNNVGGLVGNSSGLTQITDSFADAQISGTNLVGGLVGGGSTNITSSFAFGSISSTHSQLGGLVGALSNGSVFDSFAAVSIASTMPTTVGGIIGVATDSTVTNSYVDRGINSQGCIYTIAVDDVSTTVDCTEVNQSNSEPDYFFNNTTNPPLDQWDFDTVWQHNTYFFPCLQWQTHCQTFQPQMLCEMPTATATTIHGACDIQVRSGYDYGNTTWEARYKKVGDADYQPVTLDDNSVAVATITGLLPETGYYLEFRFTNNWGTGEWGRVEFVTTSFSDVNIDMSSAEDASLINFNVRGCSTLGEWQTQKESSLSVQDAAFAYPQGLIKFNLLDCPLGGQATVRLTFITNVDPNTVVVRKVNENLRSFTTLTKADNNLSVQRITYEGKTALRVEYSVTDGGVLDQDGNVNGQIQDPIGIGISTIAAPNTGLGRN